MGAGKAKKLELAKTMGENKHPVQEEGIIMNNLFCGSCKYISGSGDLYYCSKYSSDLCFAPDNDFYRCDKCLGKIKSKRHCAGKTARLGKET